MSLIEGLLVPLLEKGALSGGEFARYSGPVEIELARGDRERLLLREVGARADLLDRFVREFLDARPRHVRTVLTVSSSLEAFRSLVGSRLLAAPGGFDRGFGVEFAMGNLASNVSVDRLPELCDLIDEGLASGDGVLEATAVCRLDSASPTGVGAFSLGWKERETVVLWYGLGDDRAATKAVRQLVLSSLGEVLG